MPLTATAADAQDPKPSSPVETKVDIKAGIWSMAGTLLFVIIAGWLSGGFSIVFKELPSFLTGGVKELLANHSPFLLMIPMLLALVAIELPCILGAAILQGAILGKSGKHSISEMFANLKEGKIFRTFFILVLVEELFARSLFLGLLPKIPFLSGTVAFYVLFFIGNGLWALVHILNFKEEKDRHILRVLPQFVGGIFFTYAYVKFGLIGSILTHFASNGLIFSLHKIQRTNWVDATFVVLSAAYALVSYMLMNKPISDVAQWMTHEPTFHLQGWGFGDYVKLYIFVLSIASLVFGLLLYDKPNLLNSKQQKSISMLTLVVACAIVALPVALVRLGLCYGGFWLLGLIPAFMFKSIPYRVLILSILACLGHKSASGSAVGRTFWVSLPATFVAVCIVQALGFSDALLFILLVTGIQLPLLMLDKLED